MWRRPVVTVVILIIAVILTVPLRAQQKPFTEEQVTNMVRDGFGDDSGARLIEQRGTDFAPAEDFLQTLKAAGASAAFLKALRAAKYPQPTGGARKKPLNQVQVFALLTGQVPSHRVTMLVQERGIDFEPNGDYLQEVRLAGGQDELVSALRNAKVTKPEHVDPALQARKTDVRQHVARGAEYFNKRQYANAEAEFRAAVRLDPQNSDLHEALSCVLNVENKPDEGLAEAQEALRLNPDNDRAHFSMGDSLRHKRDWDGAIAEYREVLRQNPKDEVAHIFLGDALGHKGDLEAEIGEYREALLLNPKNEIAHTSLGDALRKKEDWDGAIGEYREALPQSEGRGCTHLPRRGA